MTYDVPRWDLDVPRWHYPCDAEMQERSSGEYVLAADAEAHEKAAVEAAFQRGLASRTVKKARVVPSASASMQTPLADKFIEKRQAREQAIRDCIAAIEAHCRKYHQMTHGVVCGVCTESITALRALLEGGE